MPLKLEEPRKGRSSNWRVRGTYLGVRLDRSTGSPDKAVARKLLLKWKGEIERGELSGRPELTFAAAALAYVNAGGETRFLKPIADHFGPAFLAKDMDQVVIDACAVAIYPAATPATRNRQVYSPISAILRHVGIEQEIRRPKGSRGKQLTHWLRLEQARAAIHAARLIDPEFAAFLILLLYTGARLSEGTGLEWRNVDLTAATALSPKTKTDEPRTMHLPPVVVAELANLPRRGDRVFRFRKSGRLYQLLRKTSEASGVELGFHMLRHTWATWMRIYVKATREDLLDTRAWADIASVRRYDHADVTETARRADLLPDLTAPIGAKSPVRKKKGVSTL